MTQQPINLNEFRKTNVRRATEGFKTYENVPITFWTTALAGELGELCNMIKKIERVKGGGIDVGSSYTAATITPEMMKEEIGGIFIYLDLLASLLKINLEEAIIETFNEKSKKHGLEQFISVDSASKQVGNVWVKASERLPGNDYPLPLKIDGRNSFGNFYEDNGEIKLHCSSASEPFTVTKNHFNNVEWLDEQPAPSLAEENRRLREAAKELLHLHSCEQEGLQSGKPTFEMWFNAVNKLSEALAGDAGNKEEK